jgi:hypothetical protein
MASAFRSDARIFKAILAKSAMDASIKWSFESKRGRMMPILHSLASKGDLILLGYQQSSILSGEIVYLNNADADDSNFRELASQIAHEMNVPFQVISSKKSESRTTTSPDSRQYPVSDNITTNQSEDQVLELLHKKSLKAAFIAIGAEQEFYIDKILEAARCPIICLVQG